MKNINRVVLGLTLLILQSEFAMANTDLNTERMNVVKQYVMDLQNANYQDISQLFEKDGYVISTSRGQMNAKDFFYAFLPFVSSANTEIHQTFISDANSNVLGARFHFTFNMKDGEKGEGEYMDEFTFSNDSTKLTSVYMFENLKFNMVKN